MQLADHSRTNSKSMSPSIYTALVDSLFENPIPMLAGAVCAGTGAVMTAVKTGNLLLWPCAGLIILIGALRAVQLSRYEKRETTLTPDEAAHWERNYMI